MVKSISWKEDLSLATEQEEIISLLSRHGLDAIADRLNYLHRLAAKDPDEQPMAVDSLRELALFLMSEQQLPEPEIAISPSGLAQVEWQVGKRGILAMEFLPLDGLIRFAAISAPAQRGVQRISVNGTLPKDHALNAVKVFTSKLTMQ